jgi:phosphoadenosine phosphosulfate reductase
MSEKDIWDAHHKFEIPYCELYAKGFRSLGAKSSTTKNSDNPAWEQDLDHTSERQGRNQDKEAIMQRLRELGYM